MVFDRNQGLINGGGERVMNWRQYCKLIGEGTRRPIAQFAGNVMMVFASAAPFLPVAEAVRASRVLTAAKYHHFSERHR
jgi:hypothetical protein